MRNGGKQFVMNNISGFIVFAFIASFATYGQEIIEPSVPNFSRYFYGIPIDPCFEYITNQRIYGDKLVKISNGSSPDISIYRSIKYKVLNPKTESEADSIQINITHLPVPIGGRNGESPFDYEHWARKTFYFSDSLRAYKSFKKLESELDTLEQRFPTMETKNSMRFEKVYSFHIDESENLNTFQIHFSIFREKDLYIIEFNHRKIYTNEPCN